MSKKVYNYSLLMPALLIFTVFFMLPIMIGLLMGFTDWKIQDISNFKFVGLNNFKSIFSDRYFILSIQNTLIYTLVTTIGKVMIGLIQALLVTGPVRGKNTFRAIFYVPALISTVVVGILFTAVLSMGGLFDSMLALMGFDNQTIMWLGNEKTALGCVMFTEVWQWSGLNMVIFINGLQDISPDYYEAASIDGASAFQRFRKITLPLLAPSITIVFINSMIGSLKVFAQIYVLTNGGPGFATQVMSTYIFRAFSAGQLGRASAMTTVLTVLVGLFVLIFMKLLNAREKA